MLLQTFHCFPFIAVKMEAMGAGITQMLSSRGKDCPPQNSTVPATNTASHSDSHHTWGLLTPPGTPPFTQSLVTCPPVPLPQNDHPISCCNLPPLCLSQAFPLISWKLYLDFMPNLPQEMWAPMRIPLPQLSQVELFPVTPLALRAGSESLSLQYCFKQVCLPPPQTLAI